MMTHTTPGLSEGSPHLTDLCTLFIVILTDIEPHEEHFSTSQGVINCSANMSSTTIKI